MDASFSNSENRYSLIINNLSSSSSYTAYRKNGAVAWRYFAPDDTNMSRGSGWKIHFSVLVKDLCNILDSIAHILIKSNIPFKCPSKLLEAQIINSGKAGISQVGKIVTAYPRNKSELEAIVLQLMPYLQQFELGPVIYQEEQLIKVPHCYVRYGIIGKSKVEVDSIGRYFHLIDDENGQLIRDEKNVNIDATNHHFSSISLKTKFINLPEHFSSFSNSCGSFIPIKKIQGNRYKSISVYLNKVDLETIVVKTVIPNTITDWQGIDLSDKLKNETRILKYLERKNFNAPRVIFESKNDTHQLGLSMVNGKPYEDLNVKEKVEYLIPLSEQLESLHELGIIHGDIKPTNIIINLKDNKLTLIDFELSNFIKVNNSDYKNFGGTLTYRSPENLDGIISKSDDIYSLGILITSIFLNSDPSNLHSNPKKIDSILSSESVPVEILALIQHLTDDADLRPNASEATLLIKRLVNDFNKGLLINNSNIKLKPKFSNLLAGYYNFCSEFINKKNNSSLTWSNNHIFSSFICESINIGNAGIVLGGLSLMSCEGRDESLELNIRGACDWLSRNKYHINSSGLFTGDAGVALSLALASNYFTNEKWLFSALERLQLAASNDLHSYDLFSGEAGILLASCIVYDLTKRTELLQLCNDLSDNIILHSEVTGGVRNWQPDPLLNSFDLPFLGVAHGTAGILVALTKAGITLDRKDLVDFSVKSFKSLVAHCIKVDKFPKVLSPNALIAPKEHWCHGLIGLLWALLYEQSIHCELSKEIDWCCKKLRGANLSINPTFCHGLAGIVETFRMLKSIPRHHDFANEMELKALCHLDDLKNDEDMKLYWNSETPNIATPDLWVGSLGTSVSISMSLNNAKGPLISSQWLNSEKLRNGN